MTESKNLEVSDAEAKDDPGRTDRNRFPGKAEELLLQASEEKSDFTSIAEKKFPEQPDKVSTGVGTGPVRTGQVGFALEADEISDIIEKDGRFISRNV